MILADTAVCSIDANEAVEGATPLHLAACKGYMSVARACLHNGANINAQDTDGYERVTVSCRVSCDFVGFFGAISNIFASFSCIFGTISALFALFCFFFAPFSYFSPTFHPF